jgi:hypothetical protein
MAGVFLFSFSATAVLAVAIAAAAGPPIAAWMPPFFQPLHSCEVPAHFLTPQPPPQSMQIPLNLHHPDSLASSRRPPFQTFASFCLP